MWLNPRLLILLASGSLIVMTGAVLGPVLPAVSTQLQLDESWAGTLVSAHYLTLAVFSPVVGMLANRIGKLRLLVFSLISYGLLGMAGALLPNFALLLLDRGLLGIATSGIAAGSLGLLTQMYRGDDRTEAIGYTSVALTLANIIYPLLAGGLGSLHWRLAFTIYGLGIPLAMGAILVFNPQALRQGRSSPASDSLTSSESADQIAQPNFKVILQQPAIFKLFLGLTMVSAIVLGMVIYLPFYLQARLAVDVGVNGIALTVMAIGSALSALLFLKWLTQNLGLFRVIPLGLGLMALCLILMPNLVQLSWILIVAFGFGLCFGVVTPSLYNGLANLTPSSLQSSILATGIGMGFLGQFLSPLVLGRVLALSNIAGVFYSVAIASLATGLLLGIQAPKPAQH